MPGLRFPGKGEVIHKHWKLILLIVIFILMLIPFGVKWYEYSHSPSYIAKVFVRAIMSGDDKAISHLNYSERSAQTIKIKWSEKLRGYEFQDFVFVPSDTLDSMVHVSTAKNKDIDLTVDVIKMNGSYYIGYVSP